MLGEGSAQYAIQGLWTAAAYDVPVTFLILRNEEYAILKWFGEIEQVTGAPGLDLPALEVASVAEGYGVPSSAWTTPARCARRYATRSPLRGRAWWKRASRRGWRSPSLSAPSPQRA